MSRWLPTLGLALCVGCAHFHPQPISAEKTAEHFDARSLSDPGLQRFLVTNNIAPDPPQWDLKALTLVAIYYQPALAEARGQLLIADAATITAGQRPNPSVSATPAYDNQIPGTPTPWIVPLTFDVPIETAGKRRQRIAQSEHLAEAARWSLVGTIWQVRSQLRAALLNLYYAHRTELLLAGQETAQSNVIHLLQGQLAAGAISEFDLTQARIAFDTTKLAEQDAIGRFNQARVDLAHVLGVPAHALDGAQFSDNEFAGFPLQLTRPAIRQQALVNRADIRDALAEYAASQSALQLEIANQYPDIHLGPGYAYNTGSAGDNEWSLGATVTLPLLNHNQGPVAEAEAKRAQAAAHFLTVQADAVAQIDGALAGYQSALNQAATAKSLLESLRQRLGAVQAQAKAGEMDPLAVATAQVEFATGEQNQLDALVKAQQSLGQLEDAVQSPITMPDSMIRTARTGVRAQPMAAEQQPVETSP